MTSGPPRPATTFPGATGPGPCHTSTWSAAGTRPRAWPCRGTAASRSGRSGTASAPHVAHTSFLKGQSRFPRFKARHRDRARFTTAGQGLQLQPGRLRIAKYGWVDLAAPCRAQAKLRRRARILNVTVSRDAGGTWYASVCFQRTAAPAPQMYSRPAGAAVGVDVGVRTAAVVATAGGTLVATLEASRALGDALTHLKHLQRALSRTQKGSANRAKARLRLGRAHARVGAVRTSRLHQFTAALAKAHRMVVVEDIATANLMRNHHLAQAIGDRAGASSPASSVTRPLGPVAPWWWPTGGSPQARRARAVVQ